MKYPNRDDRSRETRGGGKFRGTDSAKQSFGNRGENKRFGDRHAGRNSIMHKASCSECGQPCELPFKPTGDKPVFCSNCFGRKAHSNRPNRGDSVQSHFQEKRMYPAICTECGTNCEVPFRPTGGKQIYCKNCFRKDDNTGGKNTEQFKEQFHTLNAKLDTILKLLTPTLSEAATEQKEASKPEAPKPTTATKKQAKRTTPTKKTVTKKVAAKKTVAKKAASSKKTVNKKAVAKKTVAKKGTWEKSS